MDRFQQQYNRRMFEESLQKARDGSDTTLNVSGREHTAEEFAEIIDTLRNSPTLETFSCEGSKLDDTHIAQLAPVLAALPKLKLINFYRNNITGDGLALLATYFAGHPSLETLLMWGNQQLTADGARQITPLLELPTLTSLNISRNLPNDPAYNDAVREAINNANPLSKNLVDLNSGGGPDPSDPIQCNFYRISDAIKELRNLPIENWPIATVNFLYTRSLGTRYCVRQTWQELREDVKGNLFLDNLDALVDAMPLPPSNADWATVTEPGIHELRALDNPKFWSQWNSSATLSKADLLAPNRDGEPYIMTGILCEKTDAILKSLNAGGECLTPADLLGADGKPNALLQAICDFDDPAKLFTPDNWIGQQAQDATKVLRAMPKKAQERVPAHALITQLRRRQQASQAQGRS